MAPKKRSKTSSSEASTTQSSTHDRSNIRRLLSAALLPSLRRTRNGDAHAENKSRRINPEMRAAFEAADAAAEADRLANEIDAQVYDLRGKQDIRPYVDQMRVIITNIKRGDLGIRLAMKIVQPETLASMDSADMASAASVKRMKNLTDAALKRVTLSGDAMEIKMEKKDGGAKMEWVGSHDDSQLGVVLNTTDVPEPKSCSRFTKDPVNNQRKVSAVQDMSLPSVVLVRRDGRLRVDIKPELSDDEEIEGAEAAALVDTFTKARKRFNSLGNRGPVVSKHLSDSIRATKRTHKSYTKTPNLKLIAVEAVKPYLDPKYRAGEITKDDYKSRLSMTVKMLLAAGSKTTDTWTKKDIESALQHAESNK